MKAVTFAGGKPTEGEIPADLADRAKEYREKLVEAAAETDDDLLSKYLEEGIAGRGRDAEGAPGRYHRGQAHAGRVRRRVEVHRRPRRCSTSSWMRSRRRPTAPRSPAPTSRPSRPATRAVDAEGAGDGARLQDAQRSAHRQALALPRDQRHPPGGLDAPEPGAAAPGSGWGTSRGSRARLRRTSRRSAPGEIGVAQKLKETQTGDTLCEETHPFELPKITFPEAAISFAIQPKTRGDEDKISTALARIAEEDPTVHYHFDPETKQLLVSGVGSLHVEMVVERMKRKYNVDVNLLPPRIPYKETVKGRAEGQGKYKKQTGGRGQYGDTWLRVEPMARGGGFEFVDDVFGGAVPRNFIPSVEKGVRDCMKKGILAGYPVVDMKVTLYDGSSHDVDSSDMAFQIAASMGLQKVFMDARPILLEPIMNVEVTTPADHAGDVIGDLNGRARSDRGHGAGGRDARRCVRWCRWPRC